jgi:hypothetical protein
MDSYNDNLDINNAISRASNSENESELSSLISKNISNYEVLLECAKNKNTSIKDLLFLRDIGDTYFDTNNLAEQTRNSADKNLKLKGYYANNSETNRDVQRDKRIKNNDYSGLAQHQYASMSSKNREKRNSDFLLFENLDNKENIHNESILTRIFKAPGRIENKINYLNPPKGKLWVTSRRAKSGIWTIYRSFLLWFKFAFFGIIIVCATYFFFNKKSTSSILKNITKTWFSKNTSNKSNANTTYFKHHSDNKYLKIDSHNNNNNRSNGLNADLDVKRFINGDKILHAQTTEEWQNANEQKIPAWCYYNNNPNLGVLYNIYAVNDLRGLVSNGFHIPDEEEWAKLVDSKNYLYYYNSPGGFRKSNGRFSNLNKIAYYWIFSPGERNKNMAFDLKDGTFSREGDIIKNTGEGFSIRVIKNDAH